MVSDMKKNGFASMYIVYSFFLLFISVMLTVLLINTYKNRFLNTLKNDIKEDLQKCNIEIKEEEIIPEESEID